MMQRILVIGSGGSGKSTFSVRLGGLLGLRVIHLDALYWSPGWVEPDKSEWAKTVRQIMQQDSWILDGNYSGTLAERIKACDTVIFLDVARLICTWRVLKRAINHRGPDEAGYVSGLPREGESRVLAVDLELPEQIQTQGGGVARPSSSDEECGAPSHAERCRAIHRIGDERVPLVAMLTSAPGRKKATFTAAHD